MVKLTDSALREAGWDALVERLGVAGALRFLRESRIGEGDYTKIHQAWAASISRKELFKLVEKARIEPQKEIRGTDKKRSPKSPRN